MPQDCVAYSADRGASDLFRQEVREYRESALFQDGQPQALVYTGYVHERYAMDRLFFEILPRLQDVESQSVKVTKTKIQKGDGRQMGYIEIVGNQFERYEKGLEVDKRAKTNKLSMTDLKFRVVFQ